MQVPGWVLVLLACFSSIFIAIIFVAGYFIIRYQLRTRKYERIQNEKKRYVPGKTAAYFRGKYNHSSFVPLTYPTTLQSGSQLVYPSFKPKRSKQSSSTATSYYQSPMTKTLKFNPHLDSEINRSGSLDERVFRKVFVKSLQTDDITSQDGTSADCGDSVHSAPNYSQSQRSSTYVGEQSPDRRSVDHETDTIYSHSEFMFEDDKLIPIRTVDDQLINNDHVVSYDQNTEEPEKRKITPSFLFFLLEYQASEPRLLITVKHAFDLNPVGDSSGTINSYVNLCLVPEDFLWQRTKVIENNRDPVFDENFEIRDVLYHKLREYVLCFYVMDSHPVLGERVIGKVLYPLSELRAEQQVDVCKEISPA